MHYSNFITIDIEIKYLDKNILFRKKKFSMSFAFEIAIKIFDILYIYIFIYF